MQSLNESSMSRPPNTEKRHSYRLGIDLPSLLPVACSTIESAVWEKSGFDAFLDLADFLVFFAMPHDGTVRTGKKLKSKLTHYQDSIDIAGVERDFYADP